MAACGSKRGRYAAVPLLEEKESWQRACPELSAPTLTPHTLAPTSYLHKGEA